MLLCLLVSIDASAESVDGERFSFDVGVTNFLSGSMPVNDLLDTLGHADVTKWETSENLTASHLGLNFHHKAWTIGVNFQKEKLSEFEVSRSSSPYSDRIVSEVSWWSMYGERRLRVKEKIQPVLAGGITRTTINGYGEAELDVDHVKLREIEPFVRVGVVQHIKKAQLHLDFTKRFTNTDSETDNLIRLSMRLPIGY